MEVVILGSGTAVPVPDRFPAGYLVREGDLRVLVDLGPGVLRRFAQAGHTLDELDAVLLTHYHTDHCADLAALLFGLRNPSFESVSGLQLKGGPGLEPLLENLRAAWPWCRPSKPDSFTATEIGPGKFELGGLTVEAFAIEHTEASLGYRFTDASGNTAAFTGDAVYCDGVLDLARDVDLLVCDAAFPAAEPTPGHMTSIEAGRAAQQAGVKVLCMTHFYPACDGHDIAAEAATEFDGEIVLAEDLAVLRP